MESEKRLMKGDRSLDPWDPCVIIGVSLGPTLSEVEDAFALFSASNHETAYQRRKKEDAYVYLKWQLRTCGKGNAVKPTEPTTRKVELVDYKDTSSNLSPTFSTEANSKAGSFTSVSPSFARSNRFSTSSEVTTATTTTVADGGYTTRNSSVQTLKYQSDPEGSRRKSKFYTGKSKPKKPKLRGTRSTTGSSSSVGSQVSDSSTYGTRETLAAISDILQEHTKTLGNSGDSAGKNESVLRGVFRFLRRSRIGSGTSDDNISQPLAGLVLKFQQVESILDRSDTDTYDLHRKLVILYDDLSRDLRKKMKQSRGGWNSTSQSEFQQMIKGYEKRVDALTERRYPPGALGNRWRKGYVQGK